MAKEMGGMAASQIKKTKIMIEADKNRDRLCLEYKAEEAKKK